MVHQHATANQDAKDLTVTTATNENKACTKVQFASVLVAACANKRASLDGTYRCDAPLHQALRQPHYPQYPHSLRTHPAHFTVQLSHTELIGKKQNPNTPN